MAHGGGEKEDEEDEEEMEEEELSGLRGVVRSVWEELLEELEGVGRRGARGEVFSHVLTGVGERLEEGDTASRSTSEPDVSCILLLRKTA